MLRFWSLCVKILQLKKVFSDQQNLIVKRILRLNKAMSPFKCRHDGMYNM